MKMKLSREKIEDQILFAIAVAGKNASTTRAALDRFYDFDPLYWNGSPFAYVRCLEAEWELLEALYESKIGMYTKLYHAFLDAIELDVFNLTVDRLEKVTGIGPKTSRFIMLYTNPEFKGAALDTHILKYLRALGYNTPKTTPTGKRYQELEKVFLARAEELGLTPQGLDDRVWRAYARMEGEKTLKEWKLL